MSTLAIIQRSLYLEQCIKYIDTPIIKVITGMRRVGKTYFLRSVMEHLITTGVSKTSILHINKEDLAFDFIKSYIDLNSYVESYFQNVSTRKYIFLDEIQDIVEWEKCIRSLHASEEYDIYITGSNSTLLSWELSTFLTGRFVEFHIYPLSFREFLKFRGSSDAKTEFWNYIKYGWLPAIHKMQFEEDLLVNYIGWVFSTILFKDVVGRYNLRNSSQIQDILKFLSDNIGNTFSAKSISNFLKNERVKISVDTLREYLSFFENTFLLSKIQRYDIRGKNLLEISEKYYLWDLGFRSYLLGFREKDIGQILENVVYLELLTRGYSVTIGKIGDLEVDFIAEKNGKREYYQVCYLLNSPETEQREVLSLQRIHDNYPKYILSMDEFYPKSIDGIERYSLLDWLTKK